MSLLRFAPLLLSLACASAFAQTGETTRVLTREAVIAQFADEQSKFIDIDGIKVHYKDQGKGPAIVLVHGTMGDLSDWDGWAEVLAKKYRVLRLDLPGFGMSDAMRSGNYSVDRMHSLIDAFMDLQGEPRFAIAGISYGGLIAFRYAATRVDRVSALLLSNSAGIEYGKGAVVKVTPPAAGASAAPRTSTQALFNPVITAADVEANMRHMIHKQALVTPQLVQRKLAFQNIQGRDREAVLTRQHYERGDPLRVLAHVRAPVLVQWGGANKALSQETADAFVKAVKNACKAERLVYPDGGHVLIRDVAAQSASDAMAFLDKLPAAQSCRKN